MGILKNGLQKRHTGQVYFDEEGIMGGGGGGLGCGKSSLE